jgi:transcriptional regulator
MMNRRNWLLGLAAAGAPLEAQEPAAGSLYIPKPQLVEDRKFLQDFMDEFAFVDLVTAGPAIRITHVPVFLDRSAGEYGDVYGHISRHNPQFEAVRGGQSAVIVFHGPDSYIPPEWFGKHESVPTWNFAVVHASGQLQAVDDPKAIHSLLARLIEKFENGSSYRFASLPESYTSGMIAGIEGFRMRIERLEGKFKLGQDRGLADRQALLEHLKSARQPRSMAQFTADFYNRRS